LEFSFCQKEKLKGVLLMNNALHLKLLLSFDLIGVIFQ
jgi:hypothetical protein